jgi:hypothetical protein
MYHNQRIKTKTSSFGSEMLLFIAFFLAEARLLIDNNRSIVLSKKKNKHVERFKYCYKHP